MLSGAGDEAVGGVDVVDEVEAVEGGKGSVYANDIDFFVFGNKDFLDLVGTEGLVGGCKDGDDGFSGVCES